MGSREEDVGLGAELQFKCDTNLGSNHADKEKPEAWALGQVLQGSGQLSKGQRVSEKKAIQKWVRN